MSTPNQAAASRANSQARHLRHYPDHVSLPNITNSFLVDTLVIHNEWRLRRTRRVEATASGYFERLQRIVNEVARGHALPRPVCRLGRPAGAPETRPEPSNPRPAPRETTDAALQANQRDPVINATP
jgi:hypothetical protein